MIRMSEISGDFQRTFDIACARAIRMNDTVVVYEQKRGRPIMEFAPDGKFSECGAAPLRISLKERTIEQCIQEGFAAVDRKRTSKRMRSSHAIQLSLLQAQERHERVEKIHVQAHARVH